MVVRRTKEEALATRHRLLDAAEVLFQSQGVSQTSLQQIAQQAGATRGAIYWHFKDKADLFNAMMERVTLPLEAATREASTAGTDPLAAIEQVMVQALSLMVSDPQVRRVFEVATLKVEYTSDMEAVLQRHRSSRNECVIDFASALQHAARQRGHPVADPGQDRGLRPARGDQRADPGLAAGARGLRPRAGRPSTSFASTWPGWASSARRWSPTQPSRPPPDGR